MQSTHKNYDRQEEEEVNAFRTQLTCIDHYERSVKCFDVVWHRNRVLSAVIVTVVMLARLPLWSSLSSPITFLHI